jgi:hypothetical protein
MTLPLRAILALLPLSILAAEPPAAILGDWEIARVVPTTNTQVAPSPKAVGSRFSYTAAAADLAGERVEAPQYDLRREASPDFAVRYRIPVSELGVNGEHVRIVEVTKSGKPVAALGATVFLVGRRRLVTVWDGVFYEMRPARKS